jgi:HEAT repeat protein
MSLPSNKPDSTASPQGPYPPVQPPATTFLLQLFFIPLLIVLIIVAVWLLFSWLANMGNDPEDLVRDLQRLDKGSWRKAYALTNQLRDPEHDALKDDATLCRDLAAVLESENESPKSPRERTKLRIFLCRALGEFRVPDGLDPLVEAAGRQRNVNDIQVRRAALEALSILSDTLGSQVIREHDKALNVILNASRAVDADDRTSQQAMLRSTAAFTLGVVGGPAALERLVQMMDDSYSDARYNAAIGLARHGQLESVPVLLEMLDPRNLQALEGELTEPGREFKRLLVLANGIRAAEELAASTSDPTATEVAQLHSAVTTLANDETIPRRVQLLAKAAIIDWPGKKHAVEL